jgi:NAD(P)-dependent dehydrogenase (short-subunit alcohol dehydrogenase family)
MVIPGLVTYSASKAALTHFTAGLRADFRGLPIGTTLVELGPVLTDMLTHTEDYEPTARSFARTYRLRLAIKVPPTRLPKRSSGRCKMADGTYGSPSARPLSPRWPKCPGEWRRSC